jgi:hypothetical protein
MHASAWEALLRHIPGDVHHKLMLVTSSGTEITLQKILRIDRDFFAFKGRLSGTQDAGRLFFLPYTQIDYLGFQQGVKDTEYEEWFGALVIPDSDGEQAAEPAATSPAADAPAPPLSGAETQPAAEPPGSKVTPVIKSAVLERFRSRGHGSGVRPRIKVPEPPSQGG